MDKEERRLAGLRLYHQNRPLQTKQKLVEALERIATNSTIHVKSPAKLTKSNLAREAQVSIHTLLSKDKTTKEWKFKEVLTKFQELKEGKVKVAAEDVRDEKIAELRLLTSQLELDKRNQALEIDRLGIIVLEMRDELTTLKAEPKVPFLRKLGS